MRPVLFGIAAIAALGLLFGDLPLGATSVSAASIGAAPARPPYGARRRSLARPMALVTCSSQSGSGSFVAITNQDNVAGGRDAAVLGGRENVACEPYSAIAAGEYNGIANSAGTYSAEVESFIGGGSFNTISDSIDATIGGGSDNTISSNTAFIGAGAGNTATGQSSFVGSGSDNVASGTGAFVGSGNSIVSKQTSGQNVASGTDSFVGAGDLNQITNSGSFIGAGGAVYVASFGSGTKPTPNNEITGKDSFIGAGDLNLIASQEAAITAGSNNTITGHGPYAAVGGGQFNSIGGQDGFIGAGQSNSVTGAGAAIVGGASNQATGPYASVGGGSSNIASGNAATVPGGYHNLASGQFSFAAGFGSYANRSGTFVWSDDNASAPHLEPTAANQFIARATGGVVFLTNAAQTTGVMLAPGSGAWASASDRNLKRDVVTINDAAVLAKVAALPVAEWSYTSERGVRHVGPMAQDFYAAFKVGEDDRHITSIDEDGVALAAIKALHSENARLRERLTALRARDDARFASIERKLAALAAIREPKAP